MAVMEGVLQLERGLRCHAPEVDPSLVAVQAVNDEPLRIVAAQLSPSSCVRVTEVVLGQLGPYAANGRSIR